MKMYILFHGRKYLTTMKPFDLELAKQGHPVCTREGRKAERIRK